MGGYAAFWTCFLMRLMAFLVSVAAMRAAEMNPERAGIFEPGTASPGFTGRRHVRSVEGYPCAEW